MKTLDEIHEEYDQEGIRKRLWTITDFDEFTEEQKETVIREVEHVIGHLFSDIRDAMLHFAGGNRQNKIDKALAEKWLIAQGRDFDPKD